MAIAIVPALEALRDFIQGLPEFSRSQVELLESPDSLLHPTGGSQVFLQYEGSTPLIKTFDGYRQRNAEVRIILSDTNLISAYGIAEQIDSLHHHLQTCIINGNPVNVNQDVATTPDLNEGIYRYTCVAQIFL